MGACRCVPRAYVAAMTALDQLIPKPGLTEIDRIDVAAPAQRVWERVRHGDLGQAPASRALFALRALPSRLAGDHADLRLRIDALRSSPEQPGFQILRDAPPREVAVGAIGKVWQRVIPFVHVADAEAYAAFAEPGFIKVAWALRVLPLGEQTARIEFEVRVAATDEAAWPKFRRYFRVIGPGSHFIRHTLLGALERELGSLETREQQAALPGDELIPDAGAQTTHGITIEAPPERVWPWLAQMGCRRGGFYSFDLLDNGGQPSAREVHPELQRLAVGDLIPATPKGADGFEVLRVEPQHTLVLGGLYDRKARRQLAFGAPRPPRYWQVSWAFVLEPLGAHATRLCVRGRVAFPPDTRLHALWMRGVHHVMQSAQLRHLAARAEGRLERDDALDVLEGLAGAARMALALGTPFLRGRRTQLGLQREQAQRALAGDELINDPRWSYTHAIEIGAPPSQVWPWIAQIGADRGGFYSYQWLENLAGCGVRNAETIHPEWQLREGDGVVLHPRVAPLSVVRLVPGSYFVMYAAADQAARAAGKPWSAASWLLLLEPLGERRCRLISRYRCACSDDLATRLSLGPGLLEPISYAMDRRMLSGVKQRAEQADGLLRHASA